MSRHADGEMFISQFEMNFPAILGTTREIFYLKSDAGKAAHIINKSPSWCVSPSPLSSLEFGEKPRQNLIRKIELETASE